MSPLSLTNQKMNMARQLPLLLIVSLMFYISPAQANDKPVKKGKQQVAAVQAPSFTELAPGAVGNPFPFSQPETFSTPTFGDIDGDGDLDMFSGEEFGTILFFENTGDANTPNFVAQTGVNNPMDGVDAGDKSSAALVDIDGDGDLDLFVGFELGGFLFFQNDGDANTPNFSAVVGAGNPFDGVDVGNRSQLTFVDLDNDGDYDAAGGEFSGTINYFENTGDANNPAFTDLTGVSSPFDSITGNSNNSSVGLGDIDNDLDYDLVLGDKDGTVRYFENTGSVSVPTFSEVIGVTNPLDGISIGANSEPSPVVVDLNNGNGVDVILGTTAGDFYFYVNADPLPVELASFNIVKNKDKITLTWTTASETNNAGFEIQKRTSRGFEAVAWVPGAGTTTEARSYSFTVDRIQPGRQSFRLKQVDFDGAFDFSSEASVNVELSANYFLSPAAPNPFNPQTTFNLTVASSQQVTIGVYDMQGRMVQLLHSGELQAEQPYQFYVTANSWASGKYIIRAVGEAFQASQMITLLK